MIAKKNQFIRLEPPEVIIQEYQTKVQYEVIVTVQNMHSSILNLRIHQPTIKLFQTDFNQSALQIASGLSKTFAVYFKNNQSEQINDLIVIKHQFGEQRLPVRAIPPCSRIVFQQVHDFGFIRTEQPQEFKIEFKNQGSISGQVMISKESWMQAGVQMNPTKFIIAAGKSQIVRLSINAREVRVNKFICQVKIDKKILKFLQVSFAVVQYLQSLIDLQTRRKCKEIDFGTVYFGEFKVIKVGLASQSPYGLEWSSMLKSGRINATSKNMIKYQTPQQVGKQESQKIIHLTPHYGSLKAFQQLVLQFSCAGKVTEQDQLKVQREAKTGSLDLRPISFDYTLLLQFTSKQKQNKYESVLYMPIKVKCQLPSISIQPNQLFFGQCPVNSSVDLRLILINNNTKLPLDFSLLPFSSFSVNPKQAVLKPSSSIEIIVTFRPKCTGTVKKQLKLKLLQGNYQIPIDVFGHTQTYENKVRPSRGLQNTRQDFLNTKNFVEPIQERLFHSRQTATRNFMRTASVQKLRTVSRQRIGLSRERTAVTRQRGFLSRQKLSRQKASRERKQQKIESKHQFFRQSTHSRDEDHSHKEIMDQKLAVEERALRNIKEAELLDTSSKVPWVTASKLKLPQGKQRLFVIKHIFDYQPYEQPLASENIHKAEQSKDHKMVLKPCNQKQQSQISQRLKGIDLKNIISTNVLNFGKVFVNSTIKKNFSITNKLTFSIQARLEFDEKQDFGQSSLQRQIIRSNQTAVFEVCLFRCTLGQYSSSFRCIINEHHIFNVAVLGKVQLMTLSCSKNNIKLQFTQESESMQIFDNFYLKNCGNSSVKFKLECSHPAFGFIPNQGQIQPNQNSQMKIMVRYRPQPQGTVLAGQPAGRKASSSVKSDQAKLEVRIQDGLSFSVKLLGIYSQTKVFARENQIDFGKFLVGQEKIRTIAIRNYSKNSTAFEVDRNSLPQNCTVTPEQGKLQSDGTKELVVSFNSKSSGQFKHRIKILVRGGPSIVMPFWAEIILPNIQILQPQFNFRNLTTLGTGCLPLTLVNHTQVEAVLILDFQKIKNVGKFQIEPVEKKACVEYDQDEVNCKSCKITFKGSQTLHFRLTFGPRHIKNYNFQLPLTLSGYGKLLGTNRKIICVATEANFLIEPQNIDFGKKIVQYSETTLPIAADIIIHNKYQYDINWKIQEKFLLESKAFSVKPVMGTLKPSQSSKLRSNFMPQRTGFYSTRVPVLLQTTKDGPYQDYLQINLRGEGSQPRLLFDRSQIILMPVALETESVAEFKILNQGYENMTIRSRLQLDQSQFSTNERKYDTALIKLSFPQGQKISINKNKITGLISFISKKPISFTLKLEVFDTNGIVYTTTVSGTADNSILTFFPSLQKNWLGDNRQDSIIPTSKLFIQLWLQYYFPQLKMNSFPDSLIDGSGSQIFQMLYILIGKKGQIEKLVVPSDKDNFMRKLQLFKQLIVFLKSCGALINHIRPHYMLSYSQYTQLSKQENLQRLTQKTFNKYSFDCWLCLVYQVLKVFYVNRQGKAKSDPKSSQLPSSQSNVIQMQTMKWLQSCLQKYNVDYSVTNFSFNVENVMAHIVDYYFQNLMKQDKPEQDIDAKRFNLLAQYYLTMGLTLPELKNFGEKEKFMFFLHLMNNLPHFVVRQLLVFSCMLGQNCSRVIQLSNTSNKQVCYWIKMEGSSDFRPIQSQLITVQPKSSLRFEVNFVSRVSASVEGSIFFIPRRGSMSNANALVYDLKSNITGRKSIRKPQIVKSALYQRKQFKIQVINNFQNFQFAQFQVTLNYQKHDSEIGNSFVLKSDSVINSKRGSVMILELIYFPLALIVQRCFIVFCDPVVGEFQIEVIGEPDLPRPVFEPLMFQITVQQEQILEINIPIPNHQLIRTRQLIDGFISQKMRLMFSDLMAQTVQLQIQAFPKNYVKFQRSITVPRVLSIDDRKDQPETFKFPLSVLFKQIYKEYQLDLLFKNKDSSDVRRLNLLFNVLPKPTTLEIQMRCPARKTVQQSFTLSNGSDRDWKMKVRQPSESLEVLKIRNTQDKGVLKQFTVKKGSSVSFEMIFSPVWTLDQRSKVVVENLTTFLNNQYQVHMIAQQPLSQKHIHLKCKLKKEIVQMIPVTNPFPAQHKFRVVTDMLHCYGPDQLTIGPNKTVMYPYTIYPIIMGQYTGTLIFYDEIDRYIWFTFTIDTEDGTVDGTINVSAQVRRAVISSLQLANHSQKQIQFEVILTGPDLFGQSVFTIPPNSSSVYQIIFRPLQIFTAKGKVTFINQAVGERVFELNLSSQNPVTRLPILRAEIGASASTKVILQNPMNYEVKVDYRIERPQLFQVEPKIIVLQPTSQTEVTVIFNPILLSKQQSCDISFFTKTIGIWRFQALGIGVFPSKEEVTFILAKLGETSNSTIHFKNPFKEEIKVQLQLESPPEFKISLPGKGSKHIIQIKAQETVDIPIIFIPVKIMVYKCHINFILNDSFTWRKRIQGHVESDTIYLQESFYTKCRVQSHKILDIELKGMDQQVDYNDFEIELSDYEPSCKNYLLNYVTLQINKKLVVEPRLSIYVKFLPFKPFTTPAQIVIRRKKGGIWKFHAIFQADYPQFDQIILIKYEGVKAVTTSFQLLNHFQNQVHFTAKINDSASNNFSITPRTGVLKPNSSNQKNKFIITFRDSEGRYNVNNIAYLLINSQSFLWYFKIIAFMPKYRPPQQQARTVSRISGQLEKMILNQSKKNFLADNIDKLKKKRR